MTENAPHLSHKPTNESVREQAGPHFSANSVCLQRYRPWLISISLGQMKTALRSRWVAIIFATMLLASGCEKKTAATDPASQSTPGSTKPLEAADLVGYDGKRLRKSVDRIKEANEKHDQDLEKLSESGPDQ